MQSSLTQTSFSSQSEANWLLCEERLKNLALSASEIADPPLLSDSNGTTFNISLLFSHLKPIVESRDADQLLAVHVNFISDVCNKRIFSPPVVAAGAVVDPHVGESQPSPPPRFGEPMDLTPWPSVMSARASAAHRDGMSPFAACPVQRPLRLVQCEDKCISTDGQTSFLVQQTTEFTPSEENMKACYARLFRAQAEADSLRKELVELKSVLYDKEGQIKALKEIKYIKDENRGEQNNMLKQQRAIETSCDSQRQSEITEFGLARGKQAGSTVLRLSSQLNQFCDAEGFPFADAELMERLRLTRALAVESSTELEIVRERAIVEADMYRSELRCLQRELERHRSAVTEAQNALQSLTKVNQRLCTELAARKTDTSRYAANLQCAKREIISLSEKMQLREQESERYVAVLLQRCREAERIAENSKSTVKNTLGEVAQKNEYIKSLVAEQERLETLCRESSGIDKDVLSMDRVRRHPLRRGTVMTPPAHDNNIRWSMNDKNPEEIVEKNGSSEAEVKFEKPLVIEESVQSRSQNVQMSPVICDSEKKIEIAADSTSG